MTLKKYETSAPHGNSQLSKSISLLYVEDEDINWEVTLVNLRQRYNILRARNSREAFELIKSRTFVALLMDIQLSNSDLDGVGITQALRGKGKKPLPDYAQGVVRPTLPIIFMTAYSARYSRDELISLGGDELVTKPINFTQLGLCISRCILKSVAPIT